MRNFLGGRLLFIRLCLLGAVVLLTVFGIVTIYGLGHPAEAGAEGHYLVGYWKKQVAFALVGIGGFVAANLVNYRRLGAFSYGIFAAVLAVLGLVLVSKYIVPIPFIPEINGSYRWIRLSVGSHELPAIQPSELCKLAYVLALAWYLRYRSNYRNLRALAGPFAFTLLPMVLILAEPDLGTVILMMPVLFAMLLLAGAKMRHLAVVVLIVLLFSPMLWVKMRPYQRVRVSGLLLQSPWLRAKAEDSTTLADILVGDRFSEKRWRNTWGWHLIRSKYAVASGGATGYGFAQGPFVKYDFLKERHNDFIFAVVAHQWGFVGSVLVLALYAAVGLCGLEIAVHNTDPFGRLLAVGIVAMFTIEVLVNVGMTIGLMPITGLTLPWISYGGSSLVVHITAVGLLNNVGRCRPFSVAPPR